jgi:hypothetical protein
VSFCSRRWFILWCTRDGGVGPKKQFQGPVDACILQQNESELEEFYKPETTKQWHSREDEPNVDRHYRQDDVGQRITPMGPIVLDESCMVARSMANPTAGFSPMRLMTGVEMITPVLWQQRQDKWIEEDIQEEALVRLKKVLIEMEKAREAARKTAEEKRRKAKARYDKRVYIKVYQVGDEELLPVFRQKNKVSCLWNGPYMVEKKYKSGGYRLLNFEYNVVHGDKLRSYKHREDLIPEFGVYSQMYRR